MLTLRTGDTLQLAHDRLVPGSLSLNYQGKPIPESAYELLPLQGKLILRDPQYAGQFLVVQYRYFRRWLSTEYSFRTPGKTSDSAGVTGFKFNDQFFRGDETVFQTGNIRKSGSISRGITVGNNQNLSVSSGLNMQIEGDIGDGMKIVAAITDENIPIQPDGTTQQINDFDRVFIQVSKGSSYVILGDYEINHQGTEFANFYRNVQGIGFRLNQRSLSAGVSGAVAKGKFNTNSFQGRDGVQGPYRLTGKNNERFIVVLAGSEKVFINGELAVRGEGNDYTMDYNTGEISFTSQRLITSAMRIVVDFEYTDRFYNRSLFFADVSNKMLKDRLNLKFSYGRDADNQNAPISGPFSETELDTLRQAGDNSLGAFTTGVDSVGPPTEENAIHYARIDTTVNTVTYERYVFSTDPALALYTVSFSFVGAGNGFYVRDNSGVNGTIFRWVPPDSAGRPAGDFAPVKVLALPKLLQVLDLRYNYKLMPKVRLYGEGALSSEDKNRLSALGDADNVDWAGKAGIAFDSLRLGDSLQLRVDLSHRYVGQRYNNLDRVYKVEYGREWNFNDLGPRDDENVSLATVELRWKRSLSLLADGGLRLMGDSVRSIRSSATLTSSHRFLQGKESLVSIRTENEAAGSVSRWTRHNGDLYKKLGPLQPGIESWIENKNNVSPDSGQAGSFHFVDLKPYLKTVGTEKLQFHLFYNYRSEHEFYDSLYRHRSLAHTGSAKIILNPSRQLSIQNTAAYRSFKVTDQAFASKGLADANSILANMQATWTPKSKLIFANALYEITSEQVARKEVAYIKVPEGTGEYIWIDLDSNGVQTLDEFQISTIPTIGNFIRVTVPTRQLFPTTTVNLTGNVKLEFKRAIKTTKNPLLETLRNFSTVSNLRVTQRRDAGRGPDNFLVRFGDIQSDTTLLDAQYTLRQDFYFFRNSPVAEVKFSIADNQSRLFLVTGNEFRGLQFLSAEQRINFGKGTRSIENEVRVGDKLSDAPAFPTRNFDIHFVELRPKINFQLSRRFRLSAGYEYKFKTNEGDTVTDDATVHFHKIGLDAKLNLKERNNIFARLELVNIVQLGTPGFSAQYELRESLEPGLNAVWQVFLTWYLSKTLELSVTYDGRLTQEKPPVHAGRVQLRAYF